MPYYAVAKGIKPGIYTSWNVCKQNVSGYKGAIFKKFVSAQQAQQFIESNSEASRTTNATQQVNVKPAKCTIQPKTIVHHKLVPSLNISLDAEYQGLSRKFASRNYKTNAEGITIQKIYVDGASRGNGKVKLPISGYGVFYGITDERNASISLNQIDNVYANKPTNQRAELFAIKHALIDIANEINDKKDEISVKYDIYSDSQYAQSCVTKWCDDWMQNNWKTSQGKPVSNKDIISSLIPILNYINQYYNRHNFGDLQFFHVRGHIGDFGNEMADRLANIAADDMKKEILDDDHV